MGPCEAFAGNLGSCANLTSMPPLSSNAASALAGISSHYLLATLGSPVSVRSLAQASEATAAAVAACGRTRTLTCRWTCARTGSSCPLTPERASCALH